MNTLEYARIGIALNTLCILICGVMLVFLLTSVDKKTKLNRLFILLILCNIGLLLGDLLTKIIFDHTTGYNPYIFRVAQFFCYFWGYPMLWIFMEYSCAYMEQKNRVPQFIKKIIDVIRVMCVMEVILLVITQFNDMFYRIAPDNTIVRGDWFWVANIPSYVCIAAYTGMIMKYRKSIVKWEMLYLFSYMLLPALALTLQLFFPAISVVVATTLAALIVYIGIQSQQVKKLKEKELELKQNHLAIMLNQIQPHFLYNALTAIQELCHNDPETASRIVGEFSRYLRGNLDSLYIDRSIPFHQELSHVENYLVLEKIRFGPKLAIVYHISVRDFDIPALTLQSVVANAVRHGVTKREEGGTITILTSETETGCTITVTDDGVGFDASGPKQDGRSHIGMENVRNRLRAMCGGEITIRSVPGVGTTAMIKIPKKRIKGDN